jgi:hypothetical protein
MVANFFRFCLSLSQRAQYYRDIDEQASNFSRFCLPYPKGERALRRVARHPPNEDKPYHQSFDPLPFTFYLLPFSFQLLPFDFCLVKVAPGANMHYAFT